MKNKPRRQDQTQDLLVWTIKQKWAACRPYIFFTSPVSISIHLQQGKYSNYMVWPVTFQLLCCLSEPLNRPVIPGQRGTDDSRLLGLTHCLQRAPVYRFNVAAQTHFTFIYKRKKTQSSFFVKLLLQYIWISRRTDSYMKSFFAKWNIGFEGNKIKFATEEDCYSFFLLNIVTGECNKSDFLTVSMKSR